ncbi:unnamed protein product [Cuscuta campestris]|uniref:Myb/SANT-like domain-containing protein n=1 Tax=Cuscuta campestris TaxID=132261 RepID=A0A484N9S4_9ASTE|nr:unnamed protein product [Cuscuta campestris]
MDEFLLDSLMEQKLKGQKIGGVFSSTAYNVVSKNVSSKFNILCGPTHIRNRLKTLKKHLGMVKDIMQNGSGFGFNFSTKMLEAEEGVWDAYLKAKPKAAFLKYNPIPCYEILDELFGKDRATGSRAVSAKQRQMQWAKEQNYMEENEEDAVNDEVGKQNNNEESSTSKIEEPKKKKTRMVDVVSEEISLLTASIGEVATAIKLGNQRNYTEEDLFDEIASVGGMSEFSQMTIYQKLTGDVSAARAFHKCPTVHKKLWLCVKFGEEIFDDELV